MMQKTYPTILACLAMMLSTQSMADAKNIVSDDSKEGVRMICAVAGIMAQETMRDALNGVDKAMSQQQLTTKYLVAAKSEGAHRFIKNAIEINTGFAYWLVQNKADLITTLPKSEYDKFALDFGKVQFQQCLDDANRRKSQ